MTPDEPSEAVKRSEAEAVAEAENHDERKHADDHSGPVAYNYVLSTGFDLPEVKLAYGGVLVFEAARALNEKQLAALDRSMEELGYKRE